MFVLQATPPPAGFASRTLGFSGSRASGPLMARRKGALGSPEASLTSTAPTRRRLGAGLTRPQTRLRRRLPSLGTFGVMLRHHPESTAEYGGTASLIRWPEGLAGV
jgi:hypothetical protein